MERNPYPSDITDEQWSLIEPHIPPEKPGGRPRTVDMREVINGILYLNRTGCSWRMLPHDLPPWGTVHYYYWRFRREGVWSNIHDRLREQVRVAAGKEKTPSAAIIDSQSVKTAEKGGAAGTMRERKSAAESGISWSTRWG
jgi:putative transposase